MPACRSGDANGLFFRYHCFCSDALQLVIGYLKKKISLVRDSVFAVVDFRLPYELYRLFASRSAQTITSFPPSVRVCTRFLTAKWHCLRHKEENVRRIQNQSIYVYRSSSTGAMAVRLKQKVLFPPLGIRAIYSLVLAPLKYQRKTGKFPVSSHLRS